MGILRTNTVSGLETPTPVTGSVSFDGDGDFLSVASSGDLVLGNTWTVEAWMYFNEVGGGTSRNCILQSGSSVNNSGCLGIYIESGPIIRVRANALGSDVDSSSGVIISNVWHHIVVSCSNNFARIFVDGILRGNGTTNGSVTERITRIGSLTGFSDYDLNGYISNLRVLKGTALYTSNFTPPTRELQPIGDTVLLCCNNPDSAGAEATGKTITVNGNAAASTFSPGLVRDFTYGTQFEGVSKFDTQGYFVPPSGTTEQRSRGRGVFGGGFLVALTSTNIIEYIQISTQGNSQDFGDLTVAKGATSGCASVVRGLFIGGFTAGSPNTTNIIDYITISTSSNATDFGDLTVARGYSASLSNSTRGVTGGGKSPSSINVIDYVKIASIGNSQDFGDLIAPKEVTASFSSSTRGIFGGGDTSANIIEYITITSTGNSIDFGDLLSVPAFGNSGCSNSTRGIFGGGSSPLLTNTIEYITIATLGNAQDFGDLTTSRSYLRSCSNSIRGVFSGGQTPTRINTIDYVTIMTTGNAFDFGDLTSSYTSSSSQLAALSDSHGGLS